MDQAQRNYPPGTVGYLAQGRGWGKEPAPDAPAEVENDQSRAEAGDEWAERDWVDDAVWGEPDDVDRNAPTPPNGIERPPAPGAEPPASSEHPDYSAGSEHPDYSGGSDYPAAEHPDYSGGSDYPGTTGFGSATEVGYPPIARPAQDIPLPAQQTRSPAELTPAAIRHSDELESLLDAIRVPADGAGAKIGRAHV